MHGLSPASSLSRRTSVQLLLIAQRPFTLHAPANDTSDNRCETALASPWRESAGPGTGKRKLTPQIRPISARSTVAAQRLTQDHARSFCTMKTGTARVFLRLGRPQLGSPPDAGFEASPGKTESNEKKNECVFIGS